MNAVAVVSTSSGCGCLICRRPADERERIERAMRAGWRYGQLRAAHRLTTAAIAQHRRFLGLPGIVLRSPRRRRGCLLCRNQPPAVLAAVEACIRAGVRQADVVARLRCRPWSVSQHARERGLAKEPAVPPAPEVPPWDIIRSSLTTAQLVEALYQCGLRLAITRATGLAAVRGRGGTTPERVRQVVARRGTELLAYLKGQREERAAARRTALDALDAALLAEAERPARERERKARLEAAWPAIQVRLETAEARVVETVGLVLRAAQRRDQQAAARLLRLLTQEVANEWLPWALRAEAAGQAAIRTNKDRAAVLVGRAPRKGAAR